MEPLYGKLRRYGCIPSTAMTRSAFLIGTIMFLAPLVGQAQRFAHSGIGYMGGPQAAMWQSELIKYRPVPGAAAGIYAPIMLGNRIELQPELMLSFGGASRTLAEGERSTMHSLHANVPVSLKFFLTRSFNIHVGVQGGYLLFATADGTQVSEMINPLDLGATIGLGIGTWSGLDINLRYYNGLSNMLRDDRTYFPLNRTLQATIGKRIAQFKHRRVRRR